jgi:superfamily II DNA or RNA helicase
MMGEGTDIPWLDTCILAMPRARVEQPVGRIRREYDDKADAVVMDLVDADSPVFAGYASERLKWYRRIGAEVKDMN